MTGLVDELRTRAEQLGLPVDLSLGGDVAIFSPDRLHRYVLTRRIGEGSRVLVGCGLNPSTANAWKDDPTIRRCKAFGRAWGCGLYVMLNAYAWRSTDPDAMFDARRGGADIVGEHNDAAISFVLDRHAKGDEGGVPLAAWGTKADANRVGALRRLAAEVGWQWRCLGTNKDGSPCHPLYLPASTPLEPWL